MRTLALAAMLLFPACFAAAQDGPRSLTVGGLARTYVVHLPNGQRPTAPVPLVVVFHGGGGNAANAARMTGMDAKADREGFIAVYPDGTGRREGAEILLTWNTWRCCGPALDNNVDDVAFVRAMVQEVAHDYPVNRARIYATGLSNGGMMTYRVGCELSEVFAAIAPVAGALDTDQCKPVAPVSVVVFHGTADQHVRFEGGEPGTSVDRHKRTDNSVAYAVDFWRRRDGCDPEPVRSRKGKVAHDVYKCANGTAVELYAIEGQGHAWPGGQKGIRFGNVDAPTTEIAATDVMWDFFRAHPKAAP
jgi:polyhydroxybutyrate depolymerase